MQSSKAVGVTELRGDKTARFGISATVHHSQASQKDQPKAALRHSIDRVRVVPGSRMSRFAMICVEGSQLPRCEHRCTISRLGCNTTPCKSNHLCSCCMHKAERGDPVFYVFSLSDIRGCDIQMLNVKSFRSVQEIRTRTKNTALGA